MIILRINGFDYDFPEIKEEIWGEEVTQWATAITNGVLQKSGGLFTLLDDLNFGADYGVVSLYYKTLTDDLATDGNFRLGNTDSMQWRNDADDGNLKLEVIDDNLVFNGVGITGLNDYPAELGYGGF